MRRNLLFGAGGFVLGAVIFGAVATFAAGPATTPQVNTPAFQQMYSTCEGYMAQYAAPTTQAPQQ